MVRVFLARMYRSTAVRLVLLSFVLYNINLRSITSLDTYAIRHVPISIIKEFDLDLDEFSYLQKYPDWMEAEDESKSAYYVRPVRGNYMSTYPVMTAILAVPVYFLPVLLGLTDGQGSAMGYTQTEIVATILSKLSSSAAVAFSVGIIYLTLLRLTGKKSALWIALLYAFATSSWSVSSQGLWQSSMSQPLLALALYFLLKTKGNARNVIYASFPLALAVACRPPTIIFAAVFFIYVIHHHRTQVGHFLVFPGIVAMLLLTYNLYYFETLVGGYSYLGTREFFTYPRWEGFLGLLVSPSRGLLVYSPVLLFGCIGLVSTMYYRRKPVLTYAAVATVLTVLFYSTWTKWDAVFGFSYRFLVDLLPGMSLFLAVTWSWIFAQRWRIGLFVILALFSVSIQIIGSFFYPCGWSSTPVEASIHRERYWDWKDPEFLRCLRAGPVDPDGLRVIRELISRRANPTSSTGSPASGNLQGG